ncbi:MAG: DR2241 family protein [Verrucomicrobiota bacterium]
MKVSEEFLKLLNSTQGPWKLGQVLVRKNSDDLFDLCHIDDAGAEGLKETTDRYKVRHWVKMDSDGNYRPLKSEKNLQAGWKLMQLNLKDLMFCLDVIYPTAVANWLYKYANKLRVTPFSETASRQTGMYKVVSTQLTDELQNHVEENLCAKRCLKLRLWSNSGLEEKFKDSEIPLLCPEACNIFVAECRKAIKSKVQH